MKKITAYIYVLILTAMFQSCKGQSVSIEDSDFEVFPSGVTYKGKEVKLKGFLKDWIGVLGTDYRVLNKENPHQSQLYIWDSQGIGLVTIEAKDFYPNAAADERAVIKLYIYYITLDSELGKRGKLNKARFRRSPEVIFEESGGGLTDEVKNRILENYKEGNVDHKSNFRYPYTAYNKVVSVEGYAVNQGMSVVDINRERKNDKDKLGHFGYLDKDSNGIDEYGSPYVKTGLFTLWDREKKDPCSEEECLEISLRYTEGQLEYILVNIQGRGEWF